MFNSKLRNWLIVALALLACALATPALAINCNVASGTCFVIPAGGNSSLAATWSNATGGAGGAGPPTTTSNVILDSAAGQLTINANLSIGTLDASGTGGSGSPYTNTLTQNNSATLTINTAAANSLLFSSGMTYAPNSTAATTVIFANTTGTAQVTSAGKNFTGITVNGVGGTVQQLDDINITNGINITAGTLIITNGTWDANTHALTATSIFSTVVANTRGLTLGGLVTLGGNLSAGTPVLSLALGASTLTFTKNAANILVNPPSPAIQGTSFNGGGITYNGLTLAANTGANVGITMVGGNTFSSVTVGSGWNWWQTATTTTTLSASGTFTVNGTQTKPVEVISSLVTGVATISAPAGTCASTWVVLQGITATGGCTFTATNATDLGTNAGWTSITPPTFGGGGGFIGIIGG